jgi:hypothetical protein
MGQGNDYFARELLDRNFSDQERDEMEQPLVDERGRVRREELPWNIAAGSLVAISAGIGAWIGLSQV